MTENVYKLLSMQEDGHWLNETLVTVSWIYDGWGVSLGFAGLTHTAAVARAGIKGGMGNAEMRKPAGAWNERL